MLLDEIPEFEKDLADIRRMADDLEKLLEVDPSLLRDSIERALAFASRFRKEVTNQLGSSIVFGQLTLGEIAEAIRASATRERDEFNKFLVEMREELNAYEFVHASKRMQKTGQELLNAAVQEIDALKTNSQALSLFLPWFKSHGTQICKWKSAPEGLSTSICDVDFAESFVELLDCIENLEQVPRDKHENSPAEIASRGTGDPAASIPENSHAKDTSATKEDNHSRKRNAIDVAESGAESSAEGVQERNGLSESKIEMEVQAPVLESQVPTTDLEQLAPAPATGNDSKMSEGSNRTIDAIATEASKDRAVPEIEAIHVADPHVGEKQLSSTSVANAELAYWHAIGSGRYGLGYFILATLAKLTHPSDVVPAELGALAALSRNVDGSALELIAKLQSDVSSIVQHFTSFPKLWSREWKLIATASALQPALLAPDTDATSILNSMNLPRETLPAFNEICEAVREFSNTQLRVDAAVLAGVCQQARWQEIFNDAASELEEWLNREKLSSVIYAPTTNVWQTWISPQGPLGSLSNRLRDGKPGVYEEVNAFIEEWRNPRKVEDECFRTDKELRGRGAQRRKIEARALNALRQRLQAFIERLRNWLSLCDSRPESLQDYQSSFVEKCRARVLKAFPEANAEMDEYKNSSAHPVAVAVSARYASQCLSRVRDLFQSYEKVEIPRGSFNWLLNSDLAYLPDLEWDTDRTSPPEEWGEAELLSLETAANDPLGFDAVFTAQLLNHNYGTARFVLDHAVTLENRAEYEAKIDDASKRGQYQLRNKAVEIRDAIDGAVCYDLVNETERQEFIDQVESILSSQTERHDENLAAFFHQLNSIGQELSQRKTQRLSEVRDRLSKLDIPKSRLRDKQLIEATIAAGDHNTADEYISLLSDGESIAFSEDRAPPYGFYTYAESFERFCAENPNQNINDWCEAAKNQRNFGPSIPSINADEEFEPRFAMLDAWRVLKKSKPTTRSLHLQQILELLDFSQVKVIDSRDNNRDHWQAKFNCDTIVNTNACLIPQFASTARGRYEVIVVYPSSADANVEKIQQSILNRSGDAPLIVFFMGQLTMKSRRRLRDGTFGRKPFLLVDETLVAFLARMPGRVQTNFYAATLSLSGGQPFSTTASLVPVEMFFGREQEYDAIVSREGTNLVYGGRQLGKSVLLREVERKEHDPDTGSIVRWIDLKNRGIGINRPTEDVWQVIGEIIQEHGVTEKVASNPDTIRQRILEWLNADNVRRILLLMDEADAFLEQDSTARAGSDKHGFPVLSALKGLMDETERRFKVVFAGLHNVQRAAKDYNTPVAHLGLPVNIGPLLDNGQWKAAKHLIEHPLQQLGFQFEDPNLSTRILSHTNFYPSLIQIFCKHLLTSLYKKQPSNKALVNAPPFLISAEHIDEVYKSEDLQREIRDRFELTMNLDLRYRLLALLIAQSTIDSREAGNLVGGVDLRVIRESALDWWAKGFENDSSFNRFEIILDEMIGLGVLRKTEDSRFALRSANVLNLLGSRERIEEMLLDVASSEPPTVYQAATFRRTLARDFFRRSPFTNEQEGKLLERANGVVLVVGSRLSSIEDIELAFAALKEEDVSLDWCVNCTCLNQFSSWLQQSQQQAADGLTISLVNSNVGWQPSWIHYAASVVKKKTSSKRRFTRFVFIAEPIHFLHLLEDGKQPACDMIRLMPWSAEFLARWLEDNDMARDQNVVAQLAKATGGWGRLVQDFGEACKDKKHRWSEILGKLQVEWPTKMRDHDFAQLPALPERIFKSWLEFGNEPIDLATLVELAHSESPENVKLFTDWAEQLALIHRADIDRWAINPVLAASLT